MCKNCDRSSLCIGQRVLFHIHTVQYEDKTNDIVFDIMFFSKIFLKIHTIAIGCVIKSVIGCVRLWVENGKLNFFNLSLYDCSDSSKKQLIINLKVFSKSSKKLNYFLKKINNSFSALQFEFNSDQIINCSIVQLCHN